nr:MAG TPA: hypothetical protein [Caudoviricetes sp.]
MKCLFTNIFKGLFLASPTRVERATYCLGGFQY